MFQSEVAFLAKPYTVSNSSFDHWVRKIAPVLVVFCFVEKDRFFQSYLNFSWLRARGIQVYIKAFRKNNRLVIPRVSKDLGFSRFTPKVSQLENFEYIHEMGRMMLDFLSRFP